MSQTFCAMEARSLDALLNEIEKLGVGWSIDFTNDNSSQKNNMKAKAIYGKLILGLQKLPCPVT